MAARILSRARLSGDMSGCSLLLGCVSICTLTAFPLQRHTREERSVTEVASVAPEDMDGDVLKGSVVVPAEDRDVLSSDGRLPLPSVRGVW